MTSTNIARHVSRARAERLVAFGRLIANIASLTAAGLTATTADSAFPLLVIGPWTLVAAIVAWRVHRGARLSPLPLLLVLDLLVAGAMILMTGGGASPFFPFLLVTAFAASVLYGPRGMIWSAAGAVTVYIATSLMAAQVVFDLRTFIVRVGVLIVAWSIILRRANHEARTNADLEHLARWPQLIPGDRESGVRELLARASAALRSPCTVLAWETDGTPYVARFDAREATFTLDEETLDDLNAPLRAQLASQTANGWLLALDAVTPDEDDQRLAAIVARLVGSGLDQINVADMLRERSAAAERLRLSRDLHDGLLQSLGGMALHAQNAKRAIGSDPGVAKERLDAIVLQLTAGQRDLREFVDELRPELTIRREPLHARLGRLAQTIALQWNVPVDVRADRTIDEVHGRLADDVAALLTEALANAARHARATRIEAHVAIENRAVRVDVIDNGSGFPFLGRYELPELVAAGQGPWSLKERIGALGGALTIDSSPSGSSVALRVPWQAAS